MDNEIKTRYDSLPKDIQEAINSNDVMKKLQDIGAKNSLLLDRVGNLEDLVIRIMLGLDKTDDFVENVEEKLGVSTDEAIQIATDVNIAIFLPIRDSLMKLQGEKEATPSEIPAPQEDEHPMKADLLAEIENPTPVAHPISSVPPAPQTSVNTSLPTVEPTHLPTMQPQVKPVSIPAAPVMPKASITQSAQQQPAKQSVTNDFIAGKMTETVNMPPQKYSTDPYREPLN